jgi:ParB family chromosome partitioning protein
MAKHKSLGRGLEALLGADPRRRSADTDSELTEIPVDLLQRGQYQPRQDMRSESLAELAESIRAQGIVQPIVVRPIAGTGTEKRYEIVAGERRWRAAQMAGLQRVPALVRDIPDRAAVAVALIENIQREDLNPLEEARALQRLAEEFEMTHTEVADAVGRSRASVSNLLRLLELPAAIQTLLEERAIDMGHARALLGVTVPAEQLALARRVAQEGWSVRETEQAIRKLGAGKPAARAGTAAAVKDPDIRRLEQDLGERLGAKVEIRHARGSGRVVIHYHSLEELDGILDHVK